MSDDYIHQQDGACFDSLKLEHMAGLEVTGVHEDEEAVWIHFSDGTAAEIAIAEEGGFYLFIHRSDSPFKETHAKQKTVH